MTFQCLFPFSQRYSRLVELVEPSGKSDTWTVAMEKEPIWGKMSGRQQCRGTCNQNDGRKYELMMRRREICRNRNVFPSTHWSLCERTPSLCPSYREDAPTIFSPSLQDKTSPKPELSSLAMPGWDPQPSQGGRNSSPTQISFSEVKNGGFWCKICWYGNLVSKTAGPQSDLCKTILAPTQQDKPMS